MTIKEKFLPAFTLLGIGFISIFVLFVKTDFISRMGGFEIIIMLVVVFCFGLGFGMLVTSTYQASKQIMKLEEAQAKRLPHKTAAAIEDSISALINASRLHTELQNELNALGYWIEQSAKFSQGARGNEHYDIDDPTGNNIKRK